MKKKAEGNKTPADLFDWGMFWLERGDYEAALEYLIECRRIGYRKAEIKKIILENYYARYRNQHQKNYLKNVGLFRAYPYISAHGFPDFDELYYQFIPVSASRFFIFDRRKGAFTLDFDLEQKLNLGSCKENSLILINNEFRLDSILACEVKTRESRPFLWRKTPQYLFYQDFNEFVQYLQVFDFSPALEPQRLVFLFGEEELDQFFSDPQVLFPELLLNVWDKDDDIVKLINKKNVQIKENIRDLNDRLDRYYSGISKRNLLESLKSGKPRILFFTSRFTTALQYYVRDCALACDRLGIPNQVLIEKSNLHRVTWYTQLKVLDDFKPDIIFCIDHFRWENQFLPQNTVFITWVQDALSHITSEESAVRIGPLDFILNAFVTNADFLLDLGYPREAVIEAPFAANPNLYKRFSLRRAEKERYSADICAFSNAGNPQKGLDYFLTLIEASPAYDKLETVFKAAYRDMYESFYREKTFYSLDDYKRHLSGFLKVYGLSIREDDLDRLTQEWRQEVGYRVLRSVPLEWLHEKGYDMKIWGSEWLDHPLLAVYAQGVAANGETLSRIINASKIIIGTNPGITTHSRVFETFLSSSFYLAYRIPEEYDWANIRKYLSEDREVVFAYSREDLYRKVDYYLENDAERRKIIRNSKKKIKKSLTYEALISRVIKEITGRLEERLVDNTAAEIVKSSFRNGV